MPKANTNILTFDIEGFIEAAHDSMHVPEKYVSEEAQWHEIEANTMEILDILSETGQKATFFVLGRIARDMPGLVRAIADEGHEVACHGFYHRRLFNFSRDKTASLLGDAKRLLEDASGKRVYGFRAPDFSIVKSNLWALDILKEKSYLYDSSIMPTGLHDVYGIRDFPSEPFYLGNGLIEVPLTTVKILNQRVPVGGGGYLRLYPLSVTKFLFNIVNSRGTPAIVYLHPFEIGKVVPVIDELGVARKFRTYNGIKSVKGKLRSLLRSFRFSSAIDYISASKLMPA